MPRKTKAVEPESLQYESFSVTSWDGLNKTQHYYRRLNVDPAEDLKQDLPRWRNASQYLFETTAVVGGAVNALVANTIGKGLFCTPGYSGRNRTQTTSVRSRLLDIWDRWSEVAHINGQDDLSSVLRGIVSRIVVDGDVLVYLTADAAGQLKLDTIQADRIASPPADMVKAKRKVSNGVQIYLRKVEGYWIINPDAKGGFSFLPAFTPGGNINAVLLKNPYNTDRLNSYRGAPILRQCLNSVHKLEQLLDSELAASVQKTKQVAILKSGDTSNAKKGLAVDSANNLRASQFGQLNVVVIPRGDEMEILKGSDISNPNLDKVVNVYLQHIASLFNIPWNVLWNIMSESSWSSNQALKLSAYESTEIWRDYLIRNLLKPVYRLLMSAHILEGAVSGVSDSDANALKVEFSGKPAVNLKWTEVYEANRLAVASGQKSVNAVAREAGLDAYSVLEENLEYEATKRDLEREKGISVPSKEDNQRNTEIVSLVQTVISGALASEAARVILSSVYLMDSATVEAIISGITPAANTSTVDGAV